MQRSTSLITVNYGAPEFVARLVASLAVHPDRALLREVIVVDNGFPRASDSRSALAKWNIGAPVRHIGNPASSYSSGINAGAAAATGDLLILCNNDIEWLPNFSVAPLVAALSERRDVAVVGPQLVFPDGSWQRSFGLLPSINEGLSALALYELIRNSLAAAQFRLGGVARTPSTVGYIDGAFMLVRRSCFETLGGFDETLSFYGEDADFCWRAARRGHTSLFVPESRIMHVRGASSTKHADSKFFASMHRARAEFVARRQGRRAAWLYRRLLLMSTWEQALVHGLAWLVHPTARQRLRLSTAVTAARAVPLHDARNTA